MATPKLFDRWRELAVTEDHMSIRYARNESDENRAAWNAASQDAQEAYDRWRGYADDHELCVTCAGPAGDDGWARCVEHRD